MIRKYSPGFTLIEMLMVIGISTILFMGVMVIIVTIYRTNSEALQQAQFVESARRGIETFVKDAREIDYAVTGAFPLVTMLPNQFSFYADIDPDNSTEYIIYELATSSLQRTVYSATGTPPVYNSTPDSVSILATNIQNLDQAVPVFTYFNQAGTVVSDPSSDITTIRAVGIRLHINPETNASSTDFILEGRATLRNLRDTL